VYPEIYRPQFHFTPAKNWMNDPNGLVYYRGEYHLFYQHEPDRPLFWSMHWGHAVSPDLVSWEHLPVAIYPDPLLGQAYSGSAVVDHHNSSGLCGDPNGDGAPCLVALFTHHGGRDGTEKQSLAYSKDQGRHWELYAGNPVLPNPGDRDFRDPKVFWHPQTQRWVMVLAGGDRILFYGSTGLTEWTPLSELSPPMPGTGVWECPDLFPLDVEGDSGETRWVLEVDYNPGPLLCGAGAYYLVGGFDGTRFIPEESSIQRVDFGEDVYALQSWSNTPDGRRIWIGWMSNWAYALATPTHPWRGAMTVPREVHLGCREGDIVLIQQPVKELKGLRHRRLVSMREETVQGEAHILDEDATADTLEILATLEVGEASEVGLRLRTGEGEATVVGYLPEDDTLFLDRTRSGRDGFWWTFPARHSAPLTIEGDVLELRILLDWSSVEVFADGGLVVITDLIFPDPESRGLQVYTEGGEALLRSLDVYELRSIWTPP
jgi:fructan beta-fructosidase